MKPIIIPLHFNYIGVFLTFSCQLRCTYCINHHGGDLVKGRRMTPEEWINGLNRIVFNRGIPLTMQGGEPTTYKGFYEVVSGIRRELPIDLLTNLEIDPEEFARRIPPERLRREAPYASIRVSYHHGQSDFSKLTRKVLWLLERGYHIGIWEVGHPEYMNEVLLRQEKALAMGIDYRIKEFLGPWKGKDYGTLRYPNSVNNSRIRSCDCKTSELIIAPDGCIFRCHSDLYANRSSIGHILDENPSDWDLGNWKPCSVYGKCNSCDIKVKFNRFQEPGHSSVEIKNVSSKWHEGEVVKEVVNTYGKHS